MKTIVLDRGEVSGVEKDLADLALSALARLAVVERHRATGPGLLTQQQRVQLQENLHHELQHASPTTLPF